MSTKKKPGNMRIWEKHPQTDLSFTKESEYGRKQTSINPQYQKKILTEMFGPCGIGWGFDYKFWSFNATGKASKNAPEKEHLVIVCDGILWYMDNDKRYEIPVTRDKIYDVGDHTYIKLQTECISKAVTYIGVNADIFLGYHEDVDYVANSNKYEDSLIIKMLKENIDECETIDELIETWKDISNSNKKILIKYKDAKKKKIESSGKNPA